MTSLIVKINNKVKALKTYYTAYKLSLKLGANHSFLAMLRDARHCKAKYGASLEDYTTLEFWNIPENERAKWLTGGNKAYFRPYFYSQGVMNLLDDKHFINERFKDFIGRDWVYSENARLEDLFDFVNKYGKVLFKPYISSCGIGIRFVTCEDFSFLEETYGHSKFLLEEILVNHPDIAVWNTPSLQTLRVETCYDGDGKLHIMNCMLMTGASDNIQSNCHFGGIMAHVNLTTGLVDSIGRNPLGAKCTHHPVSGIEFIGHKIPMIDQLPQWIERVAATLPEARWVGWDVAITPNGFALIEGNYEPGQCTQICDMIPKYELLESYI